MERWRESEREREREAQSVLTYCLQMVLPLLLIKKWGCTCGVGGGVSDLLNGMTAAYKTGD